MVAGRPRKFSDPKKMKELLDAYFENTPDDELTITGIVIALGINKDTFYEYANKPEFKEIITEARIKVENSYERALRKVGGAANIFALKNFGWKDKTETEITGGNVSININRHAK